MRTLAVPVEDDLDDALDVISTRTGRDKLDLVGDLVRRYVQVETRFRQLADTWRRQTAHLSSIEAKSANPAYQEIIAMGRDAIPLILRELARKPDHWFYALHAITGDNPVPPESAGRLREMASAWLQYGKAHGYLS